MIPRESTKILFYAILCFHSGSFAYVTQHSWDNPIVCMYFTEHQVEYSHVCILQSSGWHRDAAAPTVHVLIARDCCSVLQLVAQLLDIAGRRPGVTCFFWILVAGMWEFRHIAEFPLYFCHFRGRCKSGEEFCANGVRVKAKKHTWAQYSVLYS